MAAISRTRTPGGCRYPAVRLLSGRRNSRFATSVTTDVADGGYGGAWRARLLAGSSVDSHRVPRRSPILQIDAPPPRSGAVWEHEQPVHPLADRAVAPPGGLLVHGAAEVEVSTVLQRPSLWSAEAPWLYTLVVELVDGGGRVVDVEASRVGVRSVSIAGGLLRVNGAPITVRGVNRHEFSPVGGRTVSWAEAVADATLMKRHNVNAVRTSHYPQSQSWYELCDAVGLYVVDEANAETHGFMWRPGDEGALAKTPTWTPALGAARSYGAARQEPRVRHRVVARQRGGLRDGARRDGSVGART